MDVGLELTLLVYKIDEISEFVSMIVVLLLVYKIKIKSFAWESHTQMREDKESSQSIMMDSN